MFNILKMIFYFIREVIFDGDKDKYDFKSSKFDPLRTSIYVGVCLSIVINVYLAVRVYKLATEMLDYKAQVEALVNTNLELSNDMDKIRSRDVLYNNYRLCIESKSKLENTLHVRNIKNTQPILSDGQMP